MRAERLISLLVLLQNHRRLTAAEAAERLGVSIRTVRRDLDVLSAAGIPVYAERGRGGGLRLDAAYTTRLTGLSPAEAEALALLASPGIVADLDLARDFDGALEKIAAAVPAVHRARSRRARDRLLFDPVPWFHDTGADPALHHLEALRGAVWADAICELDYERGDGTRKRYRVDAYALVAKVDLWYLVGRSRDGVRVFRVSRIQSLAVSAEHHARAPGFDLSEFWPAWCRRFETQPTRRYRVTVSLSAAGRNQLLERYGAWHGGPLAAWDPAAARNIVTLDLESPELAARVLFELAGEARIVEPAELKELIRQRTRALLESIGESTPPR